MISEPDGVQWTTKRIDLSMQPWNWTTFTLNAPFTQRLGVVRKTRGTVTYLMDTDSLEAVISAPPSGTMTSAVTATNVTFQDEHNHIATLREVRVRAEALSGASVNHEQRSGLLWFSLTGVQSALLAELSLGSQIEKVSGEMEIYGPLPQSLTAPPLARWRDAGGVAEVRSLRLEYGPLNLHTEGTLALDGGLQPVGAFTARLQGFHAAIDALQQGHVIDRGEALTSKLVLGALAQIDSATGKSSLNLPVSIQDRSVYVGPLKLGKIPIVYWRE